MIISKLEKSGLQYVKEIKELVKRNYDLQIDTVNLGQLYGGLRGVTSLVTETSLLDAEKGIKYRGLSLQEAREKLPYLVKGSEEVSAEALFALLLLGDVPEEEDIKEIAKEFKDHSSLPSYAIDALNILPNNLHPMNYFSTIISLLQDESQFSKDYNKGIAKQDYWRSVYIDVIRLIAKLPNLAARIYAKINDKEVIEPNNNLDWAGNFAHMLGDKEVSETSIFKEFIRLYMFLHADHEGGNGSANACHVVGTTLCNPYMAFSASMQALGGPLHGRACQDVLEWIQSMNKKIGNNRPTEEEIKQYTLDTLKSGGVVPGYGHAVLRITDPRFTLQSEFCKKYNLDSDLIQTVSTIYNVVPDVLKATGKVKNPYPNVDSHSGAILHYFGLTDPTYYTVLFGVSRSLGVLSQAVWDRLMMHPLHRPRSITSEVIRKLISSQ